MCRVPLLASKDLNIILFWKLALLSTKPKLSRCAKLAIAITDCSDLVPAPASHTLHLPSLALGEVGKPSLSIEQMIMSTVHKDSAGCILGGKDKWLRILVSL